jgi:succinoglycan biosynthesis transport protein ExoP
MRTDDGLDDIRPPSTTIADHVLGIWQRRKWVGVAVMMLVAAAACTVAASLPDVYRATATVLVERQNVSETFVRSSVTGELETRLQTISQEILSRARLAELITRLDLYPHLRGAAPTEGAIQKMRRDILLELKGVQATGGRAATVAFNLSYQGRDPETVARVANALAAFYVEENVRLRGEQATGTAAFLRVQVADARKRLDEQEQRIRDFRTRHVGELPQQLPANMATLERLHAQLDLNSANQLRAMDRRAAAAKELATGVSGAPASADAIAASLTKAQQELADLRRQYTDKHPDVIALKAAIAALRRDMAEKGEEASASTPAPIGAQTRPAPAVSKADAELAALKTQEQKLLQQIAAYQRRVENAPEREQEMQQRSADFERARELYSSLLKRYEDAQLAESMEQSSRGERFRVLDHAIPPRQPAAPARAQLVVLGLLLACGMGVAAMFAAEQLDGAVHKVADLRGLTTAPVVVSIPRITTAADRRRAHWRFCLTAMSVAVVLLVVVKTSHYIAHGNEQLLGMLARDSIRFAK